MSGALPAAVWFAAALIARAPLVARIEGTLDHDQSVVGLMALDIAAGRRFPIFFDGQRYMGAVEAYAAAAFVRALRPRAGGDRPGPLVAFGLFAAGQFVVWSRWADRPTGHLAAGLDGRRLAHAGALGDRPARGYVEFLAWALPTLAAYRVPRPARRPRLSPGGSGGLGVLARHRLLPEPALADRLHDARTRLEPRPPRRGPSP